MLCIVHTFHCTHLSDVVHFALYTPFRPPPKNALEEGSVFWCVNFKILKKKQRTVPAATTQTKGWPEPLKYIQNYNVR